MSYSFDVAQTIMHKVSISDEQAKEIAFDVMKKALNKELNLPEDAQLVNGFFEVDEYTPHGDMAIVVRKATDKDIELVKKHDELASMVFNL
jgi:hypothetical protein